MCEKKKYLNDFQKIKNCPKYCNIPPFLGITFKIIYVIFGTLLIFDCFFIVFIIIKKMVFDL
ncbi:Hypothetical Protein SLY_0535 [Strawberry lethal yellows phytoplasma (CPA) str. NZSb11]|uniref:Uncharacterized protein n=1 Tax=Strawberry lethal yellows phytoplasma (CPA) str. NZSb11 TaxID=980422 RepID=R4S106_PHYAS|nr:Hypothetical Protein SLY_0535 [Strawberry lethal yellows phytoplasma (CPA) str. NZSb11]